MYIYMCVHHCKIFYLMIVSKCKMHLKVVWDTCRHQLRNKESFSIMRWPNATWGIKSKMRSMIHLITPDRISSPHNIPKNDSLLIINFIYIIFSHVRFDITCKIIIDKCIGLYITKSVHNVITDKDTEKCK